MIVECAAHLKCIGGHQKVIFGGILRFCSDLAGFHQKLQFYSKQHIDTFINSSRILGRTCAFWDARKPWSKGSVLFQCNVCNKLTVGLNTIYTPQQTALYKKARLQ